MLLILAAGLAVTGQLWRNSVQHARNELQSAFDFSVREAITRIEQRVAAYEQVLHSAESFMSHPHGMTRDDFRNFIEKLHLDEKYPGIQGVGFVQIVPAEQRQRHIAAIRSDGFPDYTIHPGGERATYAPVIYIEPFSGRNLRAFGQDSYSSPVRRAAMDQARDLDLPVISGKVTLPQENDKNVQAGFLMYLPVFKFGTPHQGIADRRASIIGWIGAAFRMNDLMAGLHGEHAANLDFELFDGDGISTGSLMYDPDQDHVDARPAAGLFEATTLIRISNHHWTLHIHSLPAFDARLDRASPRIVAYSGAGISLLLTLLTLMLVSGRERAVLAARQITNDLIESETRYRQMFEDNDSIAYLLDPATGRIVNANAAAAEYWGYPLEQLRNMNIAAINTATRECIAEKVHQVSEGKKIHLEWRHRLNNGEFRNVEVLSSPLTYQGKVFQYSILHDITARKQAEQALLESEAGSREITSTIGEGVLVTDRNGLVTFLNPAAENFLGWSEAALLGQNGHALLHHSRANGTPYPPDECAIRRLVDSGLPFRSHDEAFWRKDGSMLPVSVIATPIIRSGKVMGSVVAFHDIVQRKKAEQALANESARNAMLLRTASDGIHVLDAQANVVQANDAFCRMLGYAPEELVGMNLAQCEANWTVEDLKAKFQQLIGRDDLFETRLRRKDGSVFDVEVHACGVAIDGENLVYASARDITERKKAAERVEHLAHFDILTDLPNRALLNDRLKQALATARRDHAVLALMFIDVDKFKPVNDRLGHDIGDLLLKEVALRMQDCVRQSDTVARIGGDEFVVLLPSIENEQGARLVAQKILSALGQPFQLASHQIDISVSIGIAIYPDDGADAHLLVRSADRAMYYVKHAGGSGLILHGNLARLTQSTDA